MAAARKNADSNMKAAVRAKGKAIKSLIKCVELSPDHWGELMELTEFAREVNEMDIHREYAERLCKNTGKSGHSTSCITHTLCTHTLCTHSLCTHHL
jgi:hypothetical protein